MNSMNMHEPHTFPLTLIDVGGYRLAYACAGVESPTVVLDAGMGDNSEVWADVWEAIACFARVCRYDRAGRGQSEPGQIPRTSQDIARELHALLMKAGVPGPYVLVGHSFGGLNTRVYADLYPTEVTGLVLVDSAHPDLDLVSLLPLATVGEAEGVRQLRELLTQESRGMNNPEGVDIVTSTAQVRAIHSFGDLPLVVLTHTSACWIEMLTANFPGLPLEVANRLEQAWQRSQRELLHLSSRSRQVIAQQSGHYIHQDEPQLIVNAIRSLCERSG